MPETSPTAPTAPAPGTCCPTPDEASRVGCALCRRLACRSCGSRVNGRVVCSACAAQIRTEIEREKAGPENLPGAVLGGVVGALLGGAVWAGVAIASGLAIGYVAILVGFLAGKGVVLGAGKRKSVQFQAVAVACAVLGLLAGKYMIVAHVISTKLPELHLGWFDGKVLRVFFQHLGEFVRPFDILWIVLALGAALRVARPTASQVRVTAAHR
jgi:hypothetical protein